MAQFDLKIVYQTGQIAIDVTNLGKGSEPQFVQGDSLDLRIWLIQVTAGVASYLPVAGITLFVALGNVLPVTPGYYTEQATWTPSADPANPFFEANLPMNTSAINDLFTGTQRSVTADFGVTFYSGGLPTTALLKSVQIRKALITPDSTTVPAGQTPLSVEVANASYLPIGQVFYGPIYLGNESDHTKINRLYTDTDGSFKISPYTP